MSNDSHNERLLIVLHHQQERQLQHARIACDIEIQLSQADRRKIKREIRKACQRYDRQAQMISS